MAIRTFRKQQTFWRVNENIRAATLRVIGPEGKQIGVISREEALIKAREMELDLVEIGPRANPPVAKIIDFTKFKYHEEKKEREQKLKERKGSEQKEIWFTPFMADNDYLVRLGRVKEFLLEGHKVRIIVKFTGRQMAHQEFGHQLTNRIADDTKDMARPEGMAKFMGRQLITFLSPVKSTQIKEEKDENQTQSKQSSGAPDQSNKEREVVAPKGI